MSQRHQGIKSFSDPKFRQLKADLRPKYVPMEERLLSQLPLRRIKRIVPIEEILAAAENNYALPLTGGIE